MCRDPKLKVAIGDNLTYTGITIITGNSPAANTTIGQNALVRQAFELASWRWTHGDALLPLAELAPRRALTVVDITLDRALPMWVAPVVDQTSGSEQRRLSNG